jgi:hypothetical protein
VPTCAVLTQVTGCAEASILAASIKSESVTGRQASRCVVNLGFALCAQEPAAVLIGCPRHCGAEYDVADFKLGKRYSGMRLQLPVIEWRQIQTATGTEKRPIVEISICLGSKRFRTLATLKDRSEMIYPFLVCRSALSGNFLVDPSRLRTSQPTCPSASLASGQIPSPVKE